MILDVVPKVVEIANQLIAENSTDHDGDPTALSNLCQLHDELIETCQRQLSATGSEVLSRISLLYQLARDQQQHVTDLITLEADLYRAVVGLSLYLLRKIPDSTLGHSTIQLNLNQTIRQSFVLLTILAHLYSLSTGVHDDTAPTQFPVLVQWIDSQQEYWTEQSSTVLTFDRHVLAMEEFQLLQMANTPTPWESNEVQHAIQQNEVLVAHMSSSVLQESDHPSTTMVQIQFMKHGGMIRLVVDPVKDTPSSWWWAALTASSTVHYHPPTLTITSVVIPTNPSLQSDSDIQQEWTVRPCSLQLQVGQNGEKWRKATSSAIEQLKELEQLYDEVRLLWPDEPSKSPVSPTAPLS